LLRGAGSSELRPYLERMKLDRPRSVAEWTMQRLLAGALRRELH
jgi:hypothetical protein